MNAGWQLPFEGHLKEPDLELKDVLVLESPQVLLEPHSPFFIAKPVRFKLVQEPLSKRILSLTRVKSNHEFVLAVLFRILYHVSSGQNVLLIEVRSTLTSGKDKLSYVLVEPKLRDYNILQFQMILLAQEVFKDLLIEFTFIIRRVLLDFLF